MLGLARKKPPPMLPNQALASKFETTQNLSSLNAQISNDLEKIEGKGENLLPRSGLRVNPTTARSELNSKCNLWHEAKCLLTKE